MPLVGFEPKISAGERPTQTYALDRAATGTGIFIYLLILIALQYECVIRRPFLMPFFYFRN